MHLNLHDLLQCQLCILSSANVISLVLRKVKKTAS